MLLDSQAANKIAWTLTEIGEAVTTMVEHYKAKQPWQHAHSFDLT